MAKRFIITVGIVSIAMAIIGLWYNTTSLSVNYFSDPVQEDNMEYFYPAFYTMSAICIICYIILLICGVQFIRLRTNLVKLFIGVVIFEFVYVFSIGFFWFIPKIGMSIAGATGVANGGIMYQIFILFPLWAPFVVAWAARKIEKTAELANQDIKPDPMA